MNNSDSKKQAVARAAIDFVEYDDVIGVGTGSTVDFFIDFLKPLKNKISGTVASSLSTQQKLEANGIFNRAREKALKDIGAKREVLDKQIDNEIAEAEKEIDALRKNAPDKINKIAIETSSELLQKLIGAEVNNSSISAIVDDLSKRNGDKYYGN